MHARHALFATLVAVSAAASAPAQDAPKPAPPPQTEPAKPDTAVADLTREAAAVSKLVETDLARAFLATADQLPSIEARTLYRDPKTRKAYTEAQAAALS